MSSTKRLQQLAKGQASTLRSGTSQHSAVQALQNVLYFLGFGKALRWEQYGADGYYGPATAAAVRQFCRRNDLPGIGKEVTPAIAQKLLQRYESLDELQQLYADLQAGRIVQAYYQGSPYTIAVGALQTLLNELGMGSLLKWAQYGADGLYGPATARALAQFARQQRLSADGKALTLPLAQRIIDLLSPFYGPQWATTNVLASPGPSENLLTTFSGTQFMGKKVTANKHFLPALTRVNDYARQSGVKLYITSSFRPTSHVNGAIVKPATFSNHMIGHAIDMNLVYGSEATFLNSQALAQPVLPPPADAFIQAIRQDPVLRWGGDFKTRDVVHIDDNAYHRDPGGLASQLRGYSAAVAR
ncbi:MAG: peptidoglycan-binding protein [Bacteroidota bacterium]